MSYQEQLQAIFKNNIDQTFNPLLQNPKLGKQNKGVSFSQHISQIVNNIPQGASTSSLRNLCFGQEQQVLNNIKGFQQKTVDLYAQMEEINPDLNLKNLSLKELEIKCFELDAKIKEQTAQRVIREIENKKQRELLQLSYKNEEIDEEEDYQTQSQQISKNHNNNKKSICQRLFSEESQQNKIKDQKLGIQNKAVSKKKLVSNNKNIKKKQNKNKQEDFNLLNKNKNPFKIQNSNKNNIYTEPMFVKNNSNSENNNKLQQQQSSQQSNIVLTPQKKQQKKPFGLSFQQDENHNPNIQQINQGFLNSISNTKFNNILSNQKGFQLFSNGKKVDDLTEEELQKDYFKKITDGFSNLKRSFSKKSKNNGRAPLQPFTNNNKDNINPQLIISNNKHNLNSIFNQKFQSSSSSGKKQSHFTQFSSSKRNNRFNNFSEEKYPFLLSQERGLKNVNSECKNLFGSYNKNIINSYQKSYFSDAQNLNNFLEEDIMSTPSQIPHQTIQQNTTTISSQQPRSKIQQQQDLAIIQQQQQQLQQADMHGYPLQQHYHHHSLPSNHQQIPNYPCQICANCPPPQTVLPGMENQQQFCHPVPISQNMNYPPMSTSQLLQHNNHMFLQQQQCYQQYPQQGIYNQPATNNAASNSNINIQQEFEQMNDSVRQQLSYDLP